MTSLINRFAEIYRDIEKQADPRVKDWPLMASPWPTVWMCLAYVYWVKVLGPQYMKNKKAFQLRQVIILYNLVQTVFSVTLFLKIVSIYIIHGYSLRGCEPVDYSPKTADVVLWTYVFYLFKLIDFLDTIFFVLRKKFEHVSVLHVLHHGSVPITLWIMVKFVAGGHTLFAGLLNSCVHSFMYAYYLLTAMGPQYRKYLWWKKYLTSLQLVQFILLLIHNSQLFFIDCKYPRFVVWYFIFNGVLFFGLFMNFYVRAYLKPRTVKKQESGVSDQPAEPARQQPRRAVAAAAAVVADNNNSRAYRSGNADVLRRKTNRLYDSDLNGLVKYDDVQCPFFFDA